MSIFHTQLKNKRFKTFIFLLVLAVFSALSIVPNIANTKAGQNLLTLVNAKEEVKNEKQINRVSFPKSKEKEPLYTQWTVATAYSSEIAQTDSSPCIPAMSSFNLCKDYKEHEVEDTIAANFLPLGAKVKFPNKYGDKIFTVRDRMNARYNGTNRIDFWKAQTKQAKNFGVKSLKMEVVKY